MTITRRKLLQYSGASLLAAVGTAWSANWSSSQAATNQSLTITWLGHTCFLFSTGNLKVLVNPFRPIGCTANYKSPQIAADIVLISSQLLDEGDAQSLPGNPKVLFNGGVYNTNGIKFEGITMPHDRVGGKRFGNNVAWRWQQGGISILHMGGAAVPLDFEQKVLMGKPDLALIPTGGGPKAYNPQEAAQALTSLKPKIMIPTQYLTAAADKTSCDLVGVNDFLELVKTEEGVSINRIANNSLAIAPGTLPKQGTVITIFNDQSLLKK